MASIEHEVLVALAARKIEENIRGLVREHGDILKSMGVDIKRAGLFSLDIIEEAVATLKTKAQQAEKQQ